MPIPIDRLDLHGYFNKTVLIDDRKATCTCGVCGIVTEWGQSSSLCYECQKHLKNKERKLNSIWAAGVPTTPSPSLAKIRKATGDATYTGYGYGVTLLHDQPLIKDLKDFENYVFYSTMFACLIAICKSVFS